MDQAESSSALMGSERDYANAVILLDELDKASSQDMRFNPVNVLHTLLEPVSAARVRDLGVDVEIDASMVTWIATCNYPWRAPFTLRTRLKEFFIGMPYAEQARLVARSVVNRALSDAGVPGIKRPGRDVIVALAPLSAREIYQTVTAAVATAVKRRQRFIGFEHLPPGSRGRGRCGRRRWHATRAVARSDQAPAAAGHGDHFDPGSVRGTLPPAGYLVRYCRWNMAR